MKILTLPTDYEVALGTYGPSKHNDAKPKLTSANEGFFDWIKSHKGPKKSTADHAFDSKRILAKAHQFLEDPLQFQLTGKSFTPGDHLYFSMYNGREPVIGQMPRVFSETVKDAILLGTKLSKDIRTQGRLCEPLIEQFENTMLHEMDKEGNVAQEVLDKAMEPLVAAMPKANNSFFAKFADEQHKCDKWLGGNPFRVVPFRAPNTIAPFWHNDPMHVVVIPPVSKADFETLKKLLQVYFQYSDKQHAWFLDGILQTIDDEDFVDYEFDRPVRHLADKMSPVQMSAIYAIYSFENNSQSLYLTLIEHMEKLFMSVLKYFDLSVVEKAQ